MGTDFWKYSLGITVIQGKCELDLTVWVMSLGGKQEDLRPGNCVLFWLADLENGEYHNRYYIPEMNIYFPPLFLISKDFSPILTSTEIEQ